MRLPSRGVIKPADRRSSSSKSIQRRSRNICAARYTQIEATSQCDAGASQQGWRQQRLSSRCRRRWPSVTHEFKTGEFKTSSNRSSRHQPLADAALEAAPGNTTPPAITTPAPRRPVAIPAPSRLSKDPVYNPWPTKLQDRFSPAPTMHPLYCTRPSRPPASRVSVLRGKEPSRDAPAKRANLFSQGLWCGRERPATRGCWPENHSDRTTPGVVRARNSITKAFAS